MDKLSGVSLTQSELLSMLDSFASGGDTKKTVSVTTKGFKEGAKEVKSFIDAAKELDSIKIDEFQGQISELSKLLKGSFKNINVSSTLSKLLDPGKDVEERVKIISELYDDFMTLKGVQGSQNIVGFTDADIKRIANQQRKIEQLVEENKQARSSKESEANSLVRPVNILSAAKQKQIEKESHSTIADRLNIDSSKIKVSKGDDALLQTYQQTADVLAKMVEERRTFGKLTKGNVGDYVKQEKDILSVFNQLQQIEKQASERFQIDSSHLLSNQFKNKNGKFDFADNADKAIRAYVDQMTTGTSNALKRAQNELNDQLVKAAGRQSARTNKANEELSAQAHQSQNNIGKQVGDNVASGMNNAEKATESANEKIRDYIVSIQDSINEINRLQQVIDKGGLSEKAENDLRQQQALYLANARRLNISADQKKQIDSNALASAEFGIRNIKNGNWGEQAQEMLSQISNFTDSMQSIINRWTSFNRSRLSDAKPEQFMLANDETGFVLEGKNKKVGGTPKQVFNQTLFESKTLKEQVNSSIHSHPDEQIAAFSFDDINAAIEQKVKGIIHQYVVSLNDISMLDVSKFTDEQLSQIVETFKNNAYGKVPGGKEYFVKGEEAFNFIRDNIDQYIDNALSGLKTFLGDDSSKIDYSSLKTNIQSQISEEAISSYEDFSYILQTQIEQALDTKNIKFDAIKLDNEVINPEISRIQQSFVEDALLKSIKQVVPDIDISSVYKRTSLSDYANGTSLIPQMQQSSVRTSSEDIQNVRNLQEETKLLRSELEQLRNESNQPIINEEQLETAKSSLQMIIDYLSKLSGDGSITTLADQFNQLPEPIRKAVDELGLLNQQKNGVNIATAGGENHGIIVGSDTTLISRTGSQERYENTLRLKEALDQAAESGVNVSRILDVVFDSGKNAIFELQKTAPGNIISNIPKVGESTDNLKFNEAVLEATDEQIIKLIEDIEKLNTLGIDVDFTDNNFLFDKEKGFSIIDLKMKGEKSSNYGVDNLKDMFSFIRDEFEYAGKDTGLIDSFVERLNTAIQLKEKLQKPGGSDDLLEASSSKVSSLKAELQSINEELQRFKNTGVEPEGVKELQGKLEMSQQTARSLSDELSILYEHSVDISTYQKLEEELEEAKENANALGQELENIKNASAKNVITNKFAEQAKQELEDAQQYFKRLMSVVNNQDPDGVLSKYLLGENGIKNGQQLMQEIKQESDVILKSLYNDLNNGITRNNDDYINALQEPFKKMKASQAIGLVNYDFMKDTQFGQLYKQWDKQPESWAQYDKLNDDHFSFYGGLIDAQERLNILQKNGGQDYIAHLERVKQLQEDVQAAKERNATFKKTDIDTTELTSEQAKNKAESLLMEKQALDELIVSVEQYRKESSIFDNADSWFGHNLPDVSNLKAISKMLEDEANNLKSIDILRNNKQANIFEQSADYKFGKKANAPKELENYYEELYNSFYPKSGIAQFTGEEAIDRLNQKAKELGVTFDETSKKWVQLSQPISENLAVTDTPLQPKMDELTKSEQQAGQSGQQMGEQIIEGVSSASAEVEKLIAEYEQLDQILKTKGPTLHFWTEEGSVEYKQILDRQNAIQNQLREKGLRRSYNNNTSNYEWVNNKVSTPSAEASSAANERAAEAAQHTEQAVKKVSDAQEQVGNSAEQAGERASKSMDKIAASASNVAQKTKEAIGDAEHGEIFTKESEGWERLLDLAQKYGIEIENVEKITRQVRSGYESFTFSTKEGTKRTIGLNSKQVLTQDDIVLDRKAEEKAAKEEAKRVARIAEEKAKRLAEEQRIINEQYANNMASIDKLGQANTSKLYAEADQIKGKENTEQMADALHNVAEAADVAFESLQKIEEMWNSRLITDDQYLAAYQKYNSKEIQNGSAKGIDALNQAKYVQTQKAVDELIKSYEKLADAEEKAANATKAITREKGATAADQIRARQVQLEEQIKGKTTTDQEQSIDAAKQYYSRLQSAYAFQRDDINIKSLGFGPDDNVEKTWDVLISKAQQYMNIINKQNLHKSLTVNDAKFLENFGKLYEQAGEKAEQAGERGQKFIKSMEAAGSNIRTSVINNYNNTIGNLEVNKDSMPQAYNDQVVELQSNLDRLRNTDFGSPEWISTIDSLDKGLNRLNTDMSMRPVDEMAKSTLDRKMSEWINNNSRAGEYADQVRALQEQLSNVTSAGDQQRIAAGFEQIKAAAAEAGKVGRSFGEGLIRRFKSLGQYLLSFASFYRIIGTLKQAVNIVKELDSGLMQVRKVAQESTSTLKEWQKTTFDQADVIGGNATQIEKSTAAWLRLGKSFTESQEAAQASVKLLNVSEFENIDDATTSLVSMRQAFKDLTYEDFIDKLNGVGDNFSSSTDQLAQGMQNVSAVLKVQGNDIDQSLALLTAANDITQDMSKASMGVRTVALRIAGTKEAKEELEEYGEDTSDFVVQTASKVDAQVRGYTKTAKTPNGVSVLDENGRLRDTYDILLDIAKVYDDIVEKDNKFGTNSSNALLELLAGKTRSNILASILQNPQLLEDAYEQSKNSQGIGQKELDVYLDSIEARMAKMQNRIQELAYTTFNSDFIKAFVDGLTKGLEIITKIVDVAGALPTLLGVVGGFMLQKGGLGIGSFNKRTGQWGFGGMPGAIGGLWKKISTASGKRNTEVASYLAGYNLDQKLFGEGGALAGKNLSNAPEALQRYTKEAINAGNATATVGDALNATSKSITGFSGLLVNAGNLALSFFSTMGTMAIAMAASWALGKIAEGIYKVINSEKILIENGKKATDSINDRYKAYSDLKDGLGDIEKNITGEDKAGTTEQSISKIAEKYNELHDGVNELSNANQNLSTEKYQEYLSLCNQLAEQSPELVSGYDAQGNAILNLGNTASEAESALIRMYEAEKLASNVEIAEDIQTSYEGMDAEITKKVKENKRLQGEIESLDEDIAKNEDKSVTNYGEITHVDGNNFTVSQNSQEVQEALEDALKKLGLSIGSTIGDWTTSGSEMTYVINGLDKLDDAAIKELQKTINSIIDNNSVVEGNELNAQKNEKQKQQVANNLFIEDQKKSIQGVINKYLTTSDTFSGQSDEIQNAILSNLDSLDLSLIEDKYTGQIIPYIYGELIGPISELTPDVQSKLAELFELKPDNIPAKEYAQKMTDIINSTFTEESDRIRWSELFGVDTAQEEINSLTSKVKDEFTDVFGNNYLTNEQLEQLFGLSLDDLRIYADLVRDGVYDTWEELQQAFERAKKQNEPEYTDTFASLLNDETYKESSEKSASNLSSLTGALETLRTEGQLTAEQMRDLQQTFPNLTDFSSKSIKTTAFKELDKWITDIRSHMDGMSEEGKKQVQTYIKNLVDSYGDLDLSIGDIADSFVADRGHVGYEAAQDRGIFNRKVEELRSGLAAEGIELDTHVLYTLVASDQFSGTADEIIEKYKDNKFLWEIVLENQDLEKDITKQQALVDNYQAIRSKKEANGEIITSGDYSDISALEQIAEDRRQEAQNAWDLFVSATEEDKDANYVAWLNAETAARNAEAEAVAKAKEQQEAGANEELANLEASNDALADAQRAITAAEKDGGKASAELYESVASQYDNQAETNRKLGDIFQGLADNTTNQAWKTEWTNKANEYYDAALQNEADAKEQRLIPIQDEYNKLQNESTAIQHELTEAEQKHQKVSAKTYRDLISNGRKQIDNLKQQQKGVKEFSDEWWSLQNSIDSMSDSMYDWSSTMDSLVYTQAQELASTISTAMSESVSETGLTDDTINALKTAFSDLDGSKFDVSDAFYSTADGVKVNTEALQELTEAEFELIGTPLANEIADVQAQLDANPGDSALQQKLENLMETNAKYFAQYEEMQKALSRNAAIDLAEGTSNAGANYDENYGRVKTYKEAREKGLIGTDDFKAWTSYLDVYGRNTIEAYDAISSKIDRYFTEDAADGLGNFLTDMEKLGYAAQDADGYWTITADDYDAAAKDMQMGSEWFMDTMRKLEDFGMIHTYVSSLNEAQLKTRDVEEQIADAVQTYSEMVARGASDEDLQKQIEHINELESQWQDLDTVTKTWGETTEANRRKEFLGIDDQLSAFEEMYKNADTDAGREAARKAAEDYVKQFGYTLDEAAKDGKFSLSAESQADYESRFTKKGSIESPLSAMEMNISEENKEAYKTILGQIQERYGKDGDFGNLLNNIHKMSAEELKSIDHADGQWTKGEASLEQICDTLGVSYENADLLIDALSGLGLIEFPGVLDSLPTQFDTLDNFLANATKGSGAGYQISTDIFGQSVEQLQNQMDEIGTLELQVDPNSDVYEQLQELKKQTEIQLNIKNSEYTQEQLKEWAETGDRQQIANTFGIDVNSEEVDQYIQQIKSTQLDYDMVIHVDDTQFSALMEAITGEPYQANVDITADGSEAEQVAEDTKQHIEKKPIIQTIQQKIQSFGNAVAGLFGGGQQQQQDVKASAQLDTSSGEKELGKFSKDVSNINKTSGTATADINISAAMGKIAILKDALNSLSGVRPMPIIDQSSINNAINRVNHLIQKLNESKNAGKAFGTAYALGTTSLSRAYAGGSQDWTVGRDESALVNEIGQESRVRDGVWELIPGGPHVEDLKKDDIIFNAEQTADLIRTGRTARSGKLVAHANGTVPGMSAYVTSGKSNAFKVNKKKSSSKGNSGGGNGNGGKNNTKKSKNSNKQSAFEKWLEKLFDWIEVRLDRIQRKIDLFTAKAENAIGSLTKAGEAIIGSISSNKNKEVTNAMNKISTSPSQLNNVSIRTNSNGKVIGYTGRPTQNDLLGNSVLGAVRYQKQADKVASKALSSGVFKSKSRKSKSAQQKYMNDLINRIQTGRIDISEYSGDIKKFIDSYKEWYDKSQDLVQSTEELKQQYKELQQQKLDNITDEFETLVGLSEAVKSSSEATIDYFNTAGFAKNTLDREEIKKQQGRQNEITNYLYSEFQTYQKELQNAAKVFGTNSNEYHEAQTKLEEINKSLIESQKTERELSHELYNLGETVRDYFIDRVKSFIDKLGSTGSLAEKRGTNAVYGYKQTEDPYIEQTRYNNELILQYYERIKKAQKEIATQGDQINSEEYEKLYKTITDSESAITSLLSTNEDLKESIRTLRWKGYNDFQEKLNTIKSDLEHLQGFIRDGDILDDDAQFTDLGFAQIALIGEQMDAAEQKIRNAQGAITKLNEEYGNGVISLEKYNEELDAQIDIIQDASGSMFDYQQKLADMYIDQITAENDALQDLISARKDALSAKKEYYDWDKTLRNKNKDIAQLQAQINALQGVSNDAAQARRAKLQAELSEKQEDLNDTLYQHSIELQQEGYDKLSEDMQTALDNAIKLINGDQKVLQETANHMLNQLIASGLEQKDIISSIINDNATRVHDSTQTIIEKLEGEGGVEQLLSDINLSARTIGDAVNARALDGSVSNINTVLSIMQDSLGDDISGQLKAIEFAIGTLSSGQKEKEEQNRQQRKEVIEYQLSDINAQKTAIESNISSHSSSIDEKQAQIKTLENANDAINKNIANLYKSADNSFKQANTLQQQAQDLLKKADKAKKKADKKKYKKQAADKLNQAAAKKVQGNNYIKQYEKAVAAKPAQIKVNDSAISSLKEEIASLTNEMNGWENQVADLNKAISVLEEENFELSIPDLLTNGNTAKGITNVSGAYQTPKSLITGYGIINAGNESKSEEELAKEQISSYEDKIKSYEQLLSYLEEASDAHPEFMDDIAKYKANKQKLEEAVEELKNIYGFKKGTKNLPEDLLAWTNENWDKIGPEIIVRPQDNAILTPMKANDSVIPANLADNLFKWGAISPDKFITNPFVGKWSAEGGSSVTNNADYTAAPQTVEMHFDSLFHIEGNVDESVMPRLENLGKSLVNDRDFQKNVIKFVTKDFVRESKKQGIR